MHDLGIWELHTNVPISAQYARASFIFEQCKNRFLQFELRNHFMPLHQPTSIFHTYL